MMDRRDLLKSLGVVAAAPAGLMAGEIATRRGVRLELHDLKRGTFAVNPHTGILEQLTGRWARCLLDGDAAVTEGRWVCADEEKGEVLCLQVRDREAHIARMRRKLSGESASGGPFIRRYIPHYDQGSPYGGLIEILTGRVEVLYDWHLGHGYERLRGPVTLRTL